MLSAFLSPVFTGFGAWFRSVLPGQSPSSAATHVSTAMAFGSAATLVPAPGQSAAARPRRAGILGQLFALSLAQKLVGTARQQQWRSASFGNTYDPQFLLLAESSPDAIIVLEPVRGATGRMQDFSFRYLNPQACRLLAPAAGQHQSAQTGDQSGPALGSRLSALPFFHASGLHDDCIHVVENGQPQTQQLAVDDKQVKASRLRTCVMPFGQGVLLTFTDLSAQKELEVQLCRQAHTDALTGLPNRTLLDDRMQQAFERARRNHEAAAILMLDLDCFTALNEAHGQSAGDQVLKTVATRLKAAVRATDSVFRLGGDEFVILFTDVHPQGPVKDFARKIVISLLAPIVCNGVSLTVSASMGLAMYPAAGSTPEALLVQADIDMYRMKREHRKTEASRHDALDSQRLSLTLR